MIDTYYAYPNMPRTLLTTYNKTFSPQGQQSIYEILSRSVEF